jgi:hypothetical protein
MRFAKAIVVAVSLFSFSMTTPALDPNAAQASDANTITGGELQDLFPGQFKVVVRGVLKLYISAQQDGSLFARQTGKSDTGTWEIRADQLCIKFSKWLKGRMRCSRVVEASGWYKTADAAFKTSDATAAVNP